MRNLVGIVTVLLCVITSPLAFAVHVRSIYQDELPVASQSAQDRVTAEQQALADVFVKVSGNSHVLDSNPNLKANLEHAESYVQEYSYKLQHGTSKAPRYLLFVRFDADAINRLMSESGTTVWGQSRPLILVWLAFQPPNQQADVVESDTEIPTALKQSAKHRGLPMIFPVMDVTDMSLVSAHDITTKSLDNLQKASQRYTSNAILIGSIIQTKPDDFSSHWQLILGSDRWNWDVTGKSLQEMFTTIIDNVTDTLAARYGMVMSTAVQSELTLTITGIKEQADLLQLMKYLQHLMPVAEVQLKSVSNDEIVLDISLRGSHESFVQAISLNKNLQPVTTASAADGALEYKWGNSGEVNATERK